MRFIGNIPKSEVKLTEVPKVQRILSHLTLKQVFINVDMKDEGIFKAYHDHGYTMREIAGSLGVHYAIVSRHLHRQ